MDDTTDTRGQFRPSDPEKADWVPTSYLRWARYTSPRGYLLQQWWTRHRDMVRVNVTGTGEWRDVEIWEAYG